MLYVLFYIRMILGGKRIEPEVLFVFVLFVFFFLLYALCSMLYAI
jgi:hypothetical protein